MVRIRARLDQEDPASGVYKKSTWHHLFSIGSLIGFVVLGWYAGPTQPLIGYGGMALLVAVIARECATTPFRLRITSSALEIDSPYRRQRVPKERVSRIEIEDELVNHARHPRVTVHLTDASKPIPLKALGLQSVELYRILQAWRVEV